jgi:hypothetical protein
MWLASFSRRASAGRCWQRCSNYAMLWNRDEPEWYGKSFDREPLITVVRNNVGSQSKKADVPCLTSPSRLSAPVLKGCSHRTELCLATTLMVIETTCTVASHTRCTFWTTRLNTNRWWKPRSFITTLGFGQIRNWLIWSPQKPSPSKTTTNTVGDWTQTLCVARSIGTTRCSSTTEFMRTSLRHAVKPTG